MATCENCGSADARPGMSRCWACYQYARRNGRDRPETLMIAKAVREFDAEEERKALPARLVASGPTPGQQLGRRVREAYAERAERLKGERSTSSSPTSPSSP